VTSIRHCLGKEVSFKQVAGAMKGGFEEEFHVDLIEGVLTDEERNLAKQFENESFSTKEWNQRR